MVESRFKAYEWSLLRGVHLTKSIGDGKCVMVLGHATRGEPGLKDYDISIGYIVVGRGVASG